MKKGRNLILFRVHQCFSPPLTSSTVSRVFLSVPPPPTLPPTDPPCHAPSGRCDRGDISAVHTPANLPITGGVARVTWPITHAQRTRAARAKGWGEGEGVNTAAQWSTTFFFFLRFFSFFSARDTNTVFWLINRFDFATANKCCCFSFLISLVIV